VFLSRIFYCFHTVSLKFVVNLFVEVTQKEYLADTLNCVVYGSTFNSHQNPTVSVDRRRFCALSKLLDRKTCALK